MKKNLVLLALILLSPQIWAAGAADLPPRYLDIGGDYSYISESDNALGSKITVDLHSAGPSLALGTKFSKTSRWITHLNMSFHFPFYQIGTIDGIKGSVPMSAYNDYFMYLMNLGFLYNFVESQRFMFSVGPAFNFILTSIKGSFYNILGFYYGPSIVLSGKFFVTDRFYLGIGLIAAYNPFAYMAEFTAYRTTSNFTLVSNFSIQPRLGIGIKI